MSPRHDKGVLHEIPVFYFAREEEHSLLLKEWDYHKAQKHTAVTAVNTTYTIHEHRISKVSDSTYISMRMLLMSWMITGTQRKKARTLTHHSYSAPLYPLKRRQHTGMWWHRHSWDRTDALQPEHLYRQSTTAPMSWGSISTLCGTPQQEAKFHS